MGCPFKEERATAIGKYKGSYALLWYNLDKRMSFEAMLAHTAEFVSAAARRQDARMEGSLPWGTPACVPKMEPWVKPQSQSRALHHGMGWPSMCASRSHGRHIAPKLEQEELSEGYTVPSPPRNPNDPHDTSGIWHALHLPEITPPPHHLDDMPGRVYNRLCSCEW